MGRLRDFRRSDHWFHGRECGGSVQLGFSLPDLAFLPQAENDDVGKKKYCRNRPHNNSNQSPSCQFSTVLFLHKLKFLCEHCLRNQRESSSISGRRSWDERRARHGITRSLSTNSSVVDLIAAVDCQYTSGLSHG